MSRILKAYEARFRALLERVHARRLEEGVQRVVRRAQRWSDSQGIPLADALTRLYEDLAARPRFQRPAAAPIPSRFFCDAGLGGLARWLRAAGYQALWQAGIDDGVLLREARQLGATVLTTDGMLMERRLLRDHLVPGFWLPPTLLMPEQLALVFREFGLTLREPRCMACGGELIPTDKASLRDRIPPRTYRWLDEFFLCAGCGQLFWHGTHWEKIRGQLILSAAAARAGP
jgi:uncharacterized protein with PIN domain